MTARWLRSTMAGALMAGLSMLAPGTPFHVQGQAPSTPTQAGDRPTFGVSVRLATVDAVVTDDKGRHVTDLTPADFEVVESGRRQTVRHVVYVRTTGPPVAPTPATGGLRADGVAGTPAPEPAPAPEVRRADLPARDASGRALAIVVDDLSMLSFRSTVDTRKMLTQFLERDVAPGDLVAILRTSGGAGTLQQFTTDRRLLAAAIERVQWVGRLARFAAPVADSRDVDDPDGQLAADLLAEGSIGVLNYALRGLESLPGRKTVVFVSEGSGLGATNPRSQIPGALKRVIDRANRAGVVIYAIDPAGLRSTTASGGSDIAQRRTPNLTNEPMQVSPVPGGGGRPMEQTPAAALADSRRRWMQFDRQEWLRWLAEQTGGFAVIGQNDISRGLGRIADDTRGYYLIGFDTSLLPGARQDPDDVKIKALRPGLQIRARRGRFGPANPDADDSLSRPGDPLIAAALSPFSTGAFDIQLTALFGHDAEGAHVRAVVDVDPLGLMLADAGDSREGAVTLLMMLFNDDGDIVTQSRDIIPIDLDAAAYERARTHGLRYSVRLKVKRPGGYQVRAVIRDDRSERLGTGARFVEVPQVGKGRVALSGVILTNAAAADRPLALTFAPGSVVEYTCTVYDGRSDRTSFSTTATVLHDGKPVYTSSPAPIAGAAAGAAAVAPVSFRGRLTLARDQKPGAYTLLVRVEPAIAPGKRSSRPAATQWVDFEVR
jgi:VWFA-related protein